MLRYFAGPGSLEHSLRIARTEQHIREAREKAQEWFVVVYRLAGDPMTLRARVQTSGPDKALGSVMKGAAPTNVVEAHVFREE